MLIATVKMKKTMTTMIKRSFLILFLLSASLPGYSQKDDFGIWCSFNAEHKLFKKFELDISGALRTFDNASRIEEVFAEAGLTYKLNKYFSAGASYRITENIEDDDSYHPRHKWFVDFKGTLPVGDFSIIARAMFQRRYKTYIEDEEDEIPDSHLRGKITLFYDIPHFHLNPYISWESFMPLFKEASRTIEINRYTIGAEYNFSNKHSVEAEYIFRRDYLPHMKDLNILSLEYKFKF
jgi:hypothetical protein